MIDEEVVRENRERIYVAQCRKSYRDWVESTALFDAYRCKQNQPGHAINYHAIKKSREEREMDEVEGNSNRFGGEKGSA